MKILLRNYNGHPYVWATAKYNNNRFHVNGDQQSESNIVSIINDNRKKYVQCSSCGQVFRRGDPKFYTHKANAIKPETCFGCKHLIPDENHTLSRKYKVNPDGSFSEILEISVELKCAESGFWTYYDINSRTAINSCPKRQCANATEMEIDDFFTKHPGVFDDIITIDRLLDEGYEVGLQEVYDSKYDIEYEDEYTIGVVINCIGIVDYFYVWYNGDRYYVYYSKRYNELYCDCGGYTRWNPSSMDDNLRTEIKNKIEKLYR